MSTPGAIGGDTTRDVRDNRITSSQDGLHNRDEEKGALHFRDAQENQDFTRDAQECNMNLEIDYSDALQKLDNQFKRNKVLSVLNLIKDDLGVLNGLCLIKYNLPCWKKTCKIF